MCDSNTTNNINSGNLVQDSTLINSIVGDNNNVTIIQTAERTFSRQDQHDIDALNRIFDSFPKNFDKHLKHKLLENRQYKIDELDYLFDLEEKINDSTNYICDEDLRNKINILKKAAIKLSNLVVSRFGVDRTNPNLMVLDYPLPWDTGYRQQYEKYLQKEIPQALISLKTEYDDICHLRVLKFGS